MKFYTSRIGLLALAGGIVFLLTATAALAKNEELIGAVVKTDQGYVLSTDSGEYIVLGNRLAGLEGKTVAATGNVENGSLSSTIRVQSFKVLANKDMVDPAMRAVQPKTP